MMYYKKNMDFSHFSSKILIAKGQKKTPKINDVLPEDLFAKNTETKVRIRLLDD